jgi:hypothetical protein
MITSKSQTSLPTSTSLACTSTSTSNVDAPLISRARNQRERRWQPESLLWDPACHLLSRWFLAQLILRPWSLRRHASPKRRSTFNGLYGFISQKTEFLITTAVRISNPTCTSRKSFYTLLGSVSRHSNYGASIWAVIYCRIHGAMLLKRENGGFSYDLYAKMLS